MPCKSKSWEFPNVFYFTWPQFTRTHHLAEGPGHWAAPASLSGCGLWPTVNETILGWSCWIPGYLSYMHTSETTNKNQTVLSWAILEKHIGRRVSFPHLQDFDKDLDVDPGDTQRETTHGREHDEEHHHEHPQLENPNSHTPQVLHHHWQLRQPQQFNRGHVIVYNRDKKTTKAELDLLLI